MIKTNLGAVALPMQVPIGAEEDFEGMVDLVTMKEIVWTGEELGASFEEREIRDELKEKCEEARAPCGAGGRAGRRRHDDVPRGRGAGCGDAQGLHPQGLPGQRLLPDALRHGLQEQ